MVAAMNPFDAVGTARISAAVYDRTCRIAMGYQTERAEQQIVETRTLDPDPQWRDRMVRMVRATRDHADIRVGASVRGAIDAVGLARELAGLRGVPATDWQVGLIAAKAALTGRIKLHEACNRTPEEVVAELYEQEFGSDPDRGEGAPGEP